MFAPDSPEFLSIPTLTTADERKAFVKAHMASCWLMWAKGMQMDAKGEPSSFTAFEESIDTEFDVAWEFISKYKHDMRKVIINGVERVAWDVEDEEELNLGSNDFTPYFFETDSTDTIAEWLGVDVEMVGA